MTSGTGKIYDPRPKCKGCDTPLDDHNWQPSYKKRGQKRCSSCNGRLAKLWRDSSKDQVKEYNKKRGRYWIEIRYGITVDEWNELFEEQEGRCAICGTQEPGGHHNTFHVDHNHTTGEVRGLLCDKCNRGLGYFNDSKATLDRAIRYLKQYES